MSTGRLWGVFGCPYADLGGLIDTSCFDALDREITAGLSVVESEYTGGTLKSMGVVAPWVMGDGYRDAMQAISAMSERELVDFVALGDGVAGDGAYGDETERPFTRAQQRLLEIRHGVYFPWKVCYHLLANHRWDDKHAGEGKDFSDEAREVFARTVDFVEGLPFTEVGRAVIFGVGANDHCPLHRDTEPGRDPAVAQSVSFSPRGGKRLFLQNSRDAAPTVIDARVWWFNDMDYHGVLADPFFRYSVRVDGVLDPGFVRAVERECRGRGR